MATVTPRTIEWAKRNWRFTAPYQKTEGFTKMWETFEYHRQQYMRGLETYEEFERHHQVARDQYHTWLEANNKPRPSMFKFWLGL